MPTYGQMPVYEDEEDWIEYSERLDHFFKGNGVTEEEKKRSLFLTACGSKVYSLVKSLIAPTKPEEKSYQELIDVIKDHLQPKPLVVAERYKFHQRSQREEESVSQFMAAVRKLSEHCEFGTFLNDAIRDRFVCGLHSRNIQEKLLTESNLTAKKALEVATSMEAAGKQSLQFHETPRVQRVEVNKRQGRCYRCGKSNHLSDACFYASAKCHVCREPGHIRKMCPKLQAGGNRRKRDKDRLANTEKRSRVV